jgi:ssDNA-binding Zn-finger/Zn-ribbon topoisomerase 1
MAEYGATWMLCFHAILFLMLKILARKEWNDLWGCTYGSRECDYTKDFRIGIGMMYSPQNLIDFESDFALLLNLIRSKKAISHIKELLNSKNALIADNYGHEIYRCPKCGEFYERFFIHLDYDGGSFEVEYKCTRCKHVLNPIDYEIKDGNGREEKEINLKKYPCPKCGNYKLYEGGSLEMMWD